ncbi:hypothetical protein AAFO92_13920 [Roseovarius sp. CAU 1744]|uniref:hypothetical protein n=1 Tax=Roseovarius sp. CAU 1744 TaxID=3140368 RepID=UPI00325AE5F7
MMRILLPIACLLLAWPLFPLAEEKEGGIIGTGVIGQITALDRFEVSGMEFGFAPDFELVGVGSRDDLRLGMTLVLATGRNGADWQIHTLRYMPLLSGPVTAPGEVMGVPIVGSLPSSGSVQIDGFWTETGIVASRITEYSEETAQVSGIYDGNGRVGHVPVQSADLFDFTAGQTLTVTGQFLDGKIKAVSVTDGLFTGPSPELVLLEGFYRSMKSSGELNLHGIAFASATVEQDVGSGVLVRRCAWKGRTDFSRSALSEKDEEMVSSFCVSASN